jgi:hypothetical protein
MKNQVKHARRKVTQAQVDAMNRELELRGSKYRYAIDQDGRLCQVEDYAHDCW